ncbi:MAG: succinylglutamate desuccinylase/aspartoacylase family protein, partial [bacterium]
MMIHGDEVGSLPAGLDLARALRSGARRFGGRVSLIVGNPEAGLVDRRFLQADLNRVFLDLPPEHPAFGTHEHRRAAALAPVLDAADLFLD